MLLIVICITFTLFDIFSRLHYLPKIYDRTLDLTVAFTISFKEKLDLSNMILAVYSHLSSFPTHNVVFWGWCYTHLRVRDANAITITLHSERLKYILHFHFKLSWFCYKTHQTRCFWMLASLGQLTWKEKNVYWYEY